MHLNNACKQTDDTDCMSIIIINIKLKNMKLSLEALKEKAEVVASEELLNGITGGNVAGCHPEDWAVAIGRWLFENRFGR